MEFTNNLRFCKPKPDSFTNICETFYVTGTSHLSIATTALSLLLNGHRAILVPPQLRSTIMDGLDKKVQIIRAPGNLARLNAHWHLGFYTSGTTGSSRLVGVSVAQLELTADWYQRIYGITNRSLIVTALPATYNFVFVAGVFLASRVGADLKFFSDTGALIADLRKRQHRRDRVVVLCNPLLIEQFGRFGAVRLHNCLFDSGGAPLSTFAISKFRNEIGDLREGYGLTETCSLTHFDTEGSDASIGTVGRGMEGVGCRICDPGLPVIQIDSPNIGTVLEGGSVMNCGTFTTTDLGMLDGNGRLRILGRSDDREVCGHWPRDILDTIGEELGYDHALVRTPAPNIVKVIVSPSVSDKQKVGISKRLRHLFCNDISISVATAERGYLHSYKLNRYSKREESLRVWQSRFSVVV